MNIVATIDKVKEEVETVVTSDQTLAWYAVQTRTRHEKIVRGQLERYNIEPFLPATTRISQWKDRKKRIEFPLFAGYCFARFSANDSRYTVLQLPGVVRIVGLHGHPEPVPDEEIDSLRILLSQSGAHLEQPYHREGMMVEVVHGPLKGARGRVTRLARHSRLIISISLIQRSVAVEINDTDIIPV